MRISKSFAMMALALIITVSAPAAFAIDSKTVQFEAVRTQQAEIRAGVEAKSGLYKDMEPRTRSELLQRQTEVLSLIEGKQVPDELNPDQRIKLFNDLEWIEAAINRTADERLICEYSKTIGSNRRTKTCRTAAQVREDHERSKENFEAQQNQTRR
ncbi:hypothetical protein GCM10027431_25830 [Lysobacter rhizosphaerae]